VLAVLSAGAGCSSDDDDTQGSGNKTSSGATGGSTGATAGTGAAGRAAGGTGGTGGTTGGTGGTGAGTGGTAGTGTGATAGMSMAGSSAGGAPPQGGAAGQGAAGAATGGAPTGGMAGSLGSGGAAAGNGGGGMPATLVTPINRSATSYVLEFGDTYFEVNPMMGGRVINVHLKGGQNLLGAGKDADNMGATFWPSPQSAWTWPPTDTAASIGNINSAPYMPSNDETSMTLVGMAASSIGISVTKKFAADLAKETIVATYTLMGSGKMAAPWEITRFKQAGVTFYPTGSDTPRGNADMDPPAVTTGAGCTWVTAPGTFASAGAKDQKLFADGADGWLAHAENDWVIVKKFTDIPANMAATGESEIQVYMNNPGNSGNPTPYMEVEQQGAYGAVGTAWTVTWFVRKLPSGVMATAGNQALVDFVKSVIQ
jgi:hypothetical protein